MSNEQPKPSEWLKIREKNREESEKKTKALLKEQKLIESKPYIETIMKWFYEPEELKAYLGYFPNDKNIAKAINLMETEEPYKSILANKKYKKSYSVLWLYQSKYRLDNLRDFSQKTQEIEKEIELNQLKKHTGFSPNERQKIIDAAVRLSEKWDKWNKHNLVEELPYSDSTLNRRMRFFKIKMQIIKDEAQAIIREKEK